MKQKPFYIVILLVFTLFTDFEIQAQIPLTTGTLDITLQCSGGTANRTGIAYNPTQQYYYSVNAGAGSYPIETFSSTGTLLASIASGFSYRGFWWNPNNSTIEGKVFSSGGIVMQNVDANFFPLGTGVTIVTGSAPDAQSCGDYDWVDDEVLYYFNGSVYRYDRSTHTQIASSAITGLPVPISNLNTNSAAYTNIPGMEVGLYDGVTKSLYFINKMTGAYVATCQLPATAPTAASFQMSFENGYFWLFNSSSFQWEGYLTVSCASQASITTSTCASYTVPSGDETYTTSGVYMDTIPNSSGCDSLLTINLTILNSATGTDTRTECNSFTWIDGNNYTANNNTATYNIVGGAANGCDSLVTLDLTIINSATGTDTRTECNSFTWIDGNNYTSSNNTAIFNIVGGAANGCDSLVTLDLTINNVSDLTTTTTETTISANNTSATFQWLDCDNNYAVINGETGQSFTASANGNYAVELTESGCIDTAYCVAITTVGIVENSFGNDLIIYPNPTSGNFSIDLGAIYESSVVSITDISGKLIDSKTISQSQVLNLSIREPAGIYIVSIQAGDKNAVIRLIKE